MRYFFLTLSFFFLVLPAMAADVVDIQVKGMVCDFCAQSVTKVFMKHEPVERVDVDLDTQTISLTLKEGQDLSEEDIKQGVHYAGYDFVGLEKRADDE